MPPPRPAGTGRTAHGFTLLELAIAMAIAVVLTAMALPSFSDLMARRADVYEPKDLGDYSFPALPKQWARATGSEELEATLTRFADDAAAGRRDETAGITG